MVKRIFFVFLSLWSFTLFAQPVNDDCGGIIDLGEAPICPILDTFTNVDATLSTVFSDPTSNIPFCFEGGVVDRDVWFQFSVPASGDIIDFTISATGVEGPNGSILQPQIAVYRGDCGLDELQELDCATSQLGSDAVSFDLLGLTPGLTYFLRIADWSASATPNWGDFELCIDEYDPVFNIGDVPSTESCSGTLFDSGGPSGDYSNGENLTFTICPSEFHQCIFFDVSDFSIESGFDNLTFFAGPDISAPQITNLTGGGGGVNVQASSDCVTVLFTSDGSFTESGFELSWMCSPDTCDVQPSTCDDATPVPSIPFAATDLTTCNAWNTITGSPCNNNAWLNSDDYIFAYESPGDECISVTVTGANFGTGVGVFDACGAAATDCLGQAGGDFAGSEPVIPAVNLEEPGTYYIVVDNNAACTPFSIEIQPAECPVVFPSASLCEDALSMNGCNAQNQSTVISVAAGEGDPTFVIDDLNDGCWNAALSPANHTWFFFQAQNDGDFAFFLNAANPAEASDIDFNVWGPIIDPDDLCDFAANNQPIRSSWAGGTAPTGLADIHPFTGIEVTDECEDGAGDGFVTTIPVMTGEFYVVLVNDWGGAIQSGAITLNFAGTTSGVLEPVTELSASGDTVLCPGETAQLFADGGDIYEWFPTDGLSCDDCPNPIADPAETTTYTVKIYSLCQIDSFEIQVGRLEVDAGPDLTVCVGEEFQITASNLLGTVDYQWNAPGVDLSCLDCPAPFVTAIAPGTYTLEVSASIDNCTASDEMVLEVVDGIAPSYEISENQQLCLGETIELGGPAVPGNDYTWTSIPTGFNSNESNPVVAPTETTTYYLEVSWGDCPLPSFDSVLVEVSEIPIVDISDDVKICIGESVSMGATISEDDVVYSWTPSTGLDSIDVANPTATPSQTTQYTFTADRNGCLVTETVNVEVVQLSLEILNVDTIGICRDETVELQAFATPPGTVVSWLPNDGSLSSTTGNSVLATPQSDTEYFAQIEVDGCVFLDSTWIGVDSVPWDLTIMPIDTQVCQGEQVLLTSPTYEPGDFGEITFEWFGQGQITPDSLFNMVVTPSVTTEYSRITTNGFCSDTSFVTVNVIDASDIIISPEQPELCVGESVQLTATASFPAEYTWEPSTGLSCTDCPNPVAMPSQTTQYTVEAEFEGCPVASSVTILVSAPPMIDFPAGEICPDQSFQLNPNGDPTWEYEWSSPDDPTFSSTAVNPIVNPSSPTTYNVTVTNAPCPSVTGSLLVETYEFPILTVFMDTVACFRDSIVLSAASSSAGGSYSWDPGGGATSSILAQEVLGLTEYTVTYVSECQDTLTGSVMVEFVPNPFIDSLIVEPNDTVFEGTELILTAFTDDAPVSYLWTTGGNNEMEQTLALNVPIESYGVLITDSFGCTHFRSIDVVIEPSRWAIPNVFTPNRDQVNDVFGVVIAGENIEIESFQVWNRWGQLVFEGGEDPLLGWDGKHNGEDAVSDVYIYRIIIVEPDGTKVVESGDVTLLR